MGDKKSKAGNFHWHSRPPRVAAARQTVIHKNITVHMKYQQQRAEKKEST